VSRNRKCFSVLWMNLEKDKDRNRGRNNARNRERANVR
jgi:hypothetical protein